MTTSENLLSEALGLYTLKQPQAELIRHNENMTYKISDANNKYVLRIHKRIGTVGISPPEAIADLAIRIFKPYRRRGYGTTAFALATKYAVDEMKINELHAGVYPKNTGSQKMLKRCGYIPYPAGNLLEKHYITGEDIIQMDYIYRPTA